MVLALVARIAVALILFSAGLAKARDRKAFARVVESLGVVPGWIAGPAARLLPWTEMVTGVALIWSPAAPWAAIAAVGLMGAFSAVLGVALARGSTAECGCFGGLAVAKLSWKLVIRNLGLMILLVPVIFLSKT